MSQGGTSFLQLVRERRTRDAIYHAASYWDARAHARDGLARSLWPSNTYNELWDQRQREVLHRVLGNLEGHRVIDVGCGTGRMTRFVAEQGVREVVGVDFSEATVRAATLDTPDELASRVRYVRGDVLEGFPSLRDFDEAVVLGCLSVACRDRDALRDAVRNVAASVRVGGRVLLLEPIHRSPILRRVLELAVTDWIAVANDAGLLLREVDRMGFVPIRLVFSVKDVPRGILAPLFEWGERELDRRPFLDLLADYKLLVFERK